MVATVRRLHEYFKVMYPIPARLLLGFIVYCEIYFIVALNHGVKNFDLGIQEIVGSFTVFSFLAWLRIADDFKDYELDCRLFADRPLPSGKVTKRDLRIVATVLITFTVIINFIFMDNFIFCVILYTYGSLMAVWFFQKHKIQPSLPLALVTHNPVQLILNLYVISSVVIKYDLPVWSWINALALLTLYFPALIWEIARKIRAPKDETEYVTYSKLFGVNRPINFILILTLVDIATNFALVWNLSKITVVVLAILVSWMTWQFTIFKKNPERFKIVDRVVIYTYLQESTMVLTIAAVAIFGPIHLF